MAQEGHDGGGQQPQQQQQGQGHPSNTKVARTTISARTIIQPTTGSMIETTTRLGRSRLPHPHPGPTKGADQEKRWESSIHY